VRLPVARGASPHVAAQHHIYFIVPSSLFCHHNAAVIDRNFAMQHRSACKERQDKKEVRS
jgi:hypothetical protein